MSAALNIVDQLIAKVDAEDEKDNDPESVRFTFAYWNICGYGAPARMMLVYSNCKYKNVMYAKREEWYGDDTNKGDKFQLDLDFPNLPYLIDHKTNTRFTESKAIYAYLARQLNIGAQTDPQQAYNDMIIGVISDVWRAFSELCYRTYSDETKKQYLEQSLPPKLQLLENFLAKRKTKWFSGSDIAQCDFITFYVLFANVKLDKTVLNPKLYPQVARFYNQFDGLPFMKKYKELGFADLPLNGASAKFR
eukprot:256109_1